ncbi:MAG: hypothetical protein WAS27_04015 [Candidatus Saccharimonadales bacterium]
MTQTPRYEKTAHLVLGSINPDKETCLAHVQNYEQMRQFVQRQPLENDVTFNWSYLDPRLSRKLSICITRQAIQWRDDRLETPRFIAHATEPQLPSHKIMLGNFCLQASDICDPSKLYQRYAVLRELMVAQDVIGFGTVPHYEQSLAMISNRDTIAA